MSATSARAARRERQAARELGAERVHRRRGERAPDVTPIRLPCGASLLAEVKSRVALPALIRHALEQAAGYAKGRALPLAVVFELGKPGGIAAMRLSDFASLVGLDVERVPRPTPMKRTSRQLELFGAVT